MSTEAKWKPTRKYWLGCIVVIAIMFVTMTAEARVIKANPTNYRDLTPTLQPGDTLILLPGIYPNDLYLSGLNGTPHRWITVTGAESPEGTGAAVISDRRGCCNEVEIKNSSYLAVKNLRIVMGAPGAHGISAKGATNVVHDILIQGNVIVGQNADQQDDGISTKAPTWNWTIRDNKILGAGTGLYLGNSDATDPFINGLIENNLVQDPVGYDMEIKSQTTWPSIPGAPTGPTTTIIRNNTFIKSDGPSPDGDRPNVLTGGFPDSGPGSANGYEIYGNFFYHNPREALLQVTGRVSIHDNVFDDGQYTAVEVVQHTIKGHVYPVTLANLYNNTIYTSQNGMEFDSPAQVASNVVGNVIFAATPITGTVTSQTDNLTDSVANAGSYLLAPSFILGQADFYPQVGKVQGPPIDLSPFAGDKDYNLDFNGIRKDQFSGSPVFRGAYAGEGVNPGWKVQANIKPKPQTSPLYWLLWQILQSW